jgi:ABC-2 type transport system ATP-binding protein
MNEIINAINLSKQYFIQKRQKGIYGILKSVFHHEKEIINAVSQLNFSINKGEIIGFIGPNGAGKSTTIKMITGILTPTTGEIKTMNMIPKDKRKELVKNIGVVFGQRTQLWWNLPVLESYDLLKDIYKIPNEEYKKNLEYMDSLLDLNTYFQTPIRQLSLGQRMKVELAAALLHSPKLVLLDEPTIGLDVLVKDKLRQMILSINKEKSTTFIITTHDMLDIDKLCSRILCINKGEIIYDGSIEEIRRKYGMLSKIEFNCHEALELDVDTLKNVKVENGRYSLIIDRDKIPYHEIISNLFKYNNLYNFQIIEPNIEEIFRMFYQDNIG